MMTSTALRAAMLGLGDIASFRELLAKSTSIVRASH